jgi:hypothetical protein
LCGVKEALPGKAETFTKQRRATEQVSKALQSIFVWNMCGKSLHTERNGSSLCLAEIGWMFPIEKICKNKAIQRFEKEIKEQHTMCNDHKRGFPQDCRQQYSFCANDKREATTGPWCF